MDRNLRERRDRAADRHDSALARYPDRLADEFRREVEDVVEELREIAAEADRPSSDPVEVAKTYRWIGDACFDLALGKDQVVLTRGAQAYRRSEELLSSSDSPVDKAVLDFNYGNTLRGLSQGIDVGMLEASHLRYQSALRTFKGNHLSDRAALVEQQLRTLEPQLRLVRKHSDTQKGHARLRELSRELPSADAAERDRIQTEMAKLRQVLTRGDPGADLDDVYRGIEEQYEEHPERFGQGDAGRLELLRTQIDRLEAMFTEAEADRQATVPAPGPEAAWIELLKARLQEDEQAGVVHPDRVEALDSFLSRLGRVFATGGEDLGSLERRAEDLHELKKEAMGYAGTPSRSPGEPEPGALGAIGILGALRRHLFAEQSRPMQPTQESRACTKLVRLVVEIEEQVRSAADDEARLTRLEERVWRLATRVQEHARRHHLTIACPNFPMLSTHTEAKTLFISGGDEIRVASETLAHRKGAGLFLPGSGGGRVEDRWSQLCSASVAVFDVGVSDEKMRAQVCYELGLALALGKTSVVTCRAGERLPFNVDLAPIPLTGNVEDDAEALEHAVERALGAVLWGGGEAGLGEGPRGAIDWIEQRFPERLSGTLQRSALDMARESVEDATDFQKAIERLLGTLGADAPAAICPAWPPAYPPRSGTPRCFHVMPFRPDWAGAARNLAESVCQRSGWTYLRGDESAVQRIIRGIWTEISMASAVLVDVTGRNANVALELGLVHALGRPCRVVAQGNPENHLFPALAKVQVHPYRHGPDFDGLGTAIEEMLLEEDEHRWKAGASV